jgi:predicted Zn-dependent protease
MHHHITHRLGQALTTLALLVLLCLPVQAQARDSQSLLRDAETEKLFNDMAVPIIRAGGVDPQSVSIALLNDSDINAFTIEGQTVIFNSGLLMQADNLNQVQGVFAHELGHLTGDHVHRDISKGAYGIMLVSLLLGGLAMATGAGNSHNPYYGNSAGSAELGLGILMAGQEAATRRILANARELEGTADAAGARYLDAAHVSGKGMLQFFNKLQNLENRYNYSHSEESGYYQTHPLTPDRIRFLSDTLPKSSSWNNSTEPQLEARFQRVKAKLKGYLEEPQQVLREYPDTDQSIPAHYARAFAYNHMNQIDKAVAEVDWLLNANPHDAYFQELKGQILLEAGRPADALAPLRDAVQTTAAQPLISALFGNALFETGNVENYPEALRVLKAAIVRDRDNPLAWQTMGQIYEAQGDEAHTQLCTAETSLLNRQYPVALANARRAALTLPFGSADALRAQDIAIVAKIQVDKMKKKH